MIRRIVVALALLVMTLTPWDARAQQGAPAAKDWLRSDGHRQTSSNVGISQNGIVRVLAALALGGAGGYFAWRKTRHARQHPPPAKTHIRVIGGTLVGPKARAVVADVGGRLILLGVTEQSVRKLAWLDASEDIDASDESDESERLSRAASERQPHRQVAQHKAEPRRNASVQHSKFSDVLKDAVGIKPRAVSDSALVLAENTHDHINLSRSRGQIRNEAPLIDIEGQAAGLVSRLSKAKQ